MAVSAYFGFGRNKKIPFGRPLNYSTYILGLFYIKEGTVGPQTANIFVPKIILAV